ncbi:MAG: BON domain-containing protein [Acidobacteriota bacterium]|nr:BON domain-containing protein [Acidobacteriota bacterium]
MRKHFFLALALALLTSFAVACSSTQPPAEQVDDAVISSKVKSKITADPELNPFEIDVDTDEGVVRLSGVVESDADRMEAEKLARSTEGVMDVTNDITLGKKTAGQALSDAEITAKVKSKLAADPEVNPFNIDVDTSEGVVTLTGRVTKEAARDEAGKLAARTKGVRSVQNRIKVGDKQS